MKRALSVGLHPLAAAIVLSLLLLCLAPAPASAQSYSTPNTGVAWTLDDLVSHSGGVVTGASPNYYVNDVFAVSEKDSLNISPGTAVTVTVTDVRKNGGQIVIEIYGDLFVKGSDAAPVVFTADPATPGSWHGIVVEDNGSANISYAKFFYAGDAAVLFEDVTKNAKSSSIDHCLVDQCDDDGIDLECYDAPAFTLSNCVIRNIAENGLELEDVGRTTVNITGNLFHNNASNGVYFNSGGENATVKGNIITGHNNHALEVYNGARGIRVLNNFIYNNHEGVCFNTDSETGGEKSLIDSNVIANSGHAGIWTYHSTGHTITNNAIGGNEPGLFMAYSWNSLIAGNSIGETTLDGSLFSLDSMDLPFGLNADAAAAIGVDPSSLQLGGNSEQGIRIIYGLPGLGAETSDYSWIEVNRNNADAWGDKSDDTAMAEASIGFDFPITNTIALTTSVYTHFQVQSNGAVQLTGGPGQTDDITDYEGRGYFTNHYGGSTFLFACINDWEDESDAGKEPVEIHNGAAISMSGWGYKHFNAGDVDGDGNQVKEECTVFRWYVTENEDHGFYDSPGWNDFQAVIYPDGKIRWNVKRMDGSFFEYGRYSGLYAGDHNSPFEIQADWGIEPGNSFLFDPAKAGEVTTQVAANRFVGNNLDAIRKNGMSYGGIGVEYSPYQIIRGNVVSNSYPGVLLYGSSTKETFVSYNNLLAYIPPDKGPEQSALVNETGSPVSAEYNYWATDSPGDRVAGASIDYDPWLPQSIPDTDEAGVLLAPPKEIGAAGGVISVTGRIYPGTSITIPELALEGSVTFTLGNRLPLPALPPGIDGVGVPIAVTPSGTDLKSPVELAIPYYGCNAPNAVFYYDEETGLWSQSGLSLQGSDEQARTARLSTTHLTTFAAGNFTDEDVISQIVKHGDDWYDCFISSVGSQGGGLVCYLLLAFAAFGAGLNRYRRK